MVHWNFGKQNTLHLRINDNIMHPVNFFQIPYGKVTSYRHFMAFKDFCKLNSSYSIFSMHLEICNSVLHFSCIETVLIKEESSELSTLSEDKFAESTEVEVDNMDEQEELDYMTEEMVNRLIIAKKIFGLIYGGGGGQSDCLLYTSIKKKN